MNRDDLTGAAFVLILVSAYVGGLMLDWALGMKIGKNVVVSTSTVPVATDLITIGEGTVIRRGCSFTGYRAVAGRLQTGSVTLGSNVLVGKNTVLDIDTTMDEGAALGHSSSLQTGQPVPTGHSWHGSPAEPHHGGNRDHGL